MLDLKTSVKSKPAQDPRVRHIDEWQQLSERKREEALGKNFYEDNKAFFTMSENIVAPRYRPAVQIPELQMMCMREANDLSEFQPTVYIYSNAANKREETIEKAFHAQWNETAVPYHLLFANIWAQYCGTGFLQHGLDPRARNGNGKMWVKSRDPRTVHIDPAADYTCNWSYVILEDYMHLEMVKQRYPEKAKFLPKYPTNSSRDIRGQESQSGFRLPDGPFQSMPPFNSVGVRTGMTTRVRTIFCEDYTREIVGEPMPEQEPKMRWKYPGGRMLVECEGVILVDGPNPFPHGVFPIVPVWATPPLYGIWAVPPVRYTINLQNLAEKFYSQTYENAYRLNNGIWFIPESSEIKQSDFGGVPGEKQTYKGDKVPTFVSPPSFPDSTVKMPDILLQKQRELQGFNDSRRGEAGQGNVSVDLFDASVMRSQGMTQLRGRMASQSVSRLAMGMTYTMIEYLPDQVIPYKDNAGFQTLEWKKPEDKDPTLFLDPGAFHTQSQAVVRRVAADLMNKGILPLAEGLELIGFPNAQRIAKEADERAALAATTAAMGGTGKKR